MPTSIFRAYDIRGIVGKQLTEDVVYAIGLSIGSMAAEQDIQTVAVGRDGRLTGEAFANAMMQGLNDAGVNAIFIGIVPSPVLYYATHTLNTNTGIMITGSHNPSNYNGIKIVFNGTTLNESGVQDILHRIQAKQFTSGDGHITTVDILDDYLACIQQRIQLKRPLKIVIDAGNGVAALTAPKLYRALGCEVIDLYCEVDGTFPNHHPDPTIPDNLVALREAVLKHNADCGLAFDGDADRLGVLDDKGEIVWPDRQMMLYAMDLLERQPGAEILFDVKCTSSLAQTIEAHGGKPLMWKTGHSILKGKMIENGAPLAGEMSGHIFYKENWFGFDDGVYVGARFLDIMAKKDQPVSEVFAALPNHIATPELKLLIADDKKHAFVTALGEQADFGDATIFTIDGLRIDFGYGWGLVRASNTTPCLTLRFEADTDAHLTKIQRVIGEQILKLDNTLTLPY